MKKIEGSLKPTGPADQGSPQQGNDASMGDDETEMVALPRPAGGGRTDEIQAEENKPEVEPRRAIDISAGHSGIEAGLQKRGGGADSRESNKEQNGQIQRAKSIDSPPDEGSGDTFFPDFFLSRVNRHPMRIEGGGGRTSGALLRTGYSPAVVDLSLETLAWGRGGRIFL